MSEITVPDQDMLLLDSLRLKAPAQTNRSKWTNRRKSVGLPGAEWWNGSVSIDVISTESEERAWRAFLFALGGPANWFRKRLACDQVVANPTVAAGAGDAYTMPLAGLGASGTVLVAGQWLTVPLPSGRYRTVCLVADLVSASGTGTATFRPALGEVPTTGATVEAINPFIALSPVIDELGLDYSQGVSGASFDVEESS